MFNIGESTKISGYTGKIGTLQHALHARELRRNIQWTYFGKRVQRGTVDVLLGGEWRTVRFDSAYGWARGLEVM